MSKMLFDKSPNQDQDGAKKKKAHKPRAQPQAEPLAKQAEDLGVYGPPQPILGRLDGVHLCHKPDCGSDIFDVIDAYRGELTIECAICSWKQVVVDENKSVADEFIFPDGMFAGMTLAQASAEEHGSELIRWFAENHKSPSVTDACRKWIAAVGYSAAQ